MDTISRRALYKDRSLFLFGEERFMAGNPVNAPERVAVGGVAMMACNSFRPSRARSAAE